MKKLVQIMKRLVLSRISWGALRAFFNILLEIVEIFMLSRHR